MLFGGAGNDVLSGGDGADMLNGGSGNDTFLFDTVLNGATNLDTLQDFMAGEDKIALDSSVFLSIASSDGTLLTENFYASLTGIAADADDYILYNTSSGTLLYDADGNGDGVATEFALVSSKSTLTSESFIVVS